MGTMLNIYWLITNTVFSTPLSMRDENGEEINEYAYGYYKELGITASTEEHAKSICYNHLRITDDLSTSDIIQYEHIGLIPPSDVQSEILNDEDINDCLLQSPRKEGVWYVSGRGFYNDQDS